MLVDVLRLFPAASAVVFLDVPFRATTELQPLTCNNRPLSFLQTALATGLTPIILETRTNRDNHARDG